MSNSRPQPTLADYMAIAISPALIIALVGSLAFFLLMVFYAGDFESRLYWTTGCFVFAAVLISRISIVEGAERASLFGIALGGAAALAMSSYTNHPWWAWLVLGVIWWSASHLVWNCTLVEDDDDASGEGLLEAAGLDTPLSATGAPAVMEVTQLQRAAKRRQREEPKPPPPVVPATPQVSAVKRFFGWWQRSASRKAPPGLTVVYFSLAALPIFGLGQFFVASELRQGAFQLLLTYVANALGLLLLTSFGLRRYLRQRRLEMPIEMAGSWLVVGTVLGVAILLLAMLIPRPNPEYAISSLSGTLSSPQREASSYAPMNDSPAQGDSSTAQANDQTQADANQQQANAAAGARTENGEPAEGSRSSAESKAQSAGDQSGGSQASGQGESSPQGSSGSSGDSSDQKQQTQSQQTKQGQQQDQPDDQQRSAPAQQGEQQKNADQGKFGQQQQQQQQSSGKNSPQQEKSSADGNDQDKSQQENPEQDTTPSKDSPVPKMSAPQHSPNTPTLRPPTLPSGGGLLWLLRLLIYAVVLLVGLYFLIRYWAQVKDFLARAWREIQDLWNSLFGGKPSAPNEAVAEAAPSVRARPFASFQNPFTGAARRYPPNTIVQYSFEALEAWARERGLARVAEETPLEFAARLAADQPPLADGVRELAGLYARVAYARESLTTEHLTAVERLWGTLQRTALPVAHT